jgi:hypothetical protein
MRPGRLVGLPLTLVVGPGVVWSVIYHSGHTWTRSVQCNQRLGVEKWSEGSLTVALAIAAVDAFVTSLFGWLRMDNPGWALRILATLGKFGAAPAVLVLIKRYGESGDYMPFRARIVHALAPSGPYLMAGWPVQRALRWPITSKYPGGDRWATRSSGIASPRSRNTSTARSR